MVVEAARGRVRVRAGEDEVGVTRSGVPTFLWSRSSTASFSVWVGKARSQVTRATRV